MTSGQSDPLGGTNAYIVDDISASDVSALRVDGVTASAGDDYTLSSFIKKDASPTVYPGMLWGQSTNWRGIVIDPSDGSFVNVSFTSAGTTAVVEDYDANWWRAKVSGSSGFASQRVYLYPAYNSTGTGTSNTASTGTNIFFGAQFEQCSSATYYKKTELFTVDVDYISTGSAVYEATPSSSITATVDFIPSGSATYEATPSVGAVTATADYIASGSATYEATPAPGAVTKTADYIGSGSAVYEPTLTTLVAGQINADFISSGSAVYEPTASPGSVTKIADYIGSGSATYEPTAASVYTLTPDYISTGSATYEPTLTSPSVTVNVTYIASGSRVYEASITGGIPVVSGGGGFRFDKKGTRRRYNQFMRNREADALADAEFMRMLLGEQLQPGEKVVVDNLHKKVRVRLEIDAGIDEVAAEVKKAVPFPVIIERMTRKKRRVVTKEVIMRDDAEIMKRLFNI